MDNPEFVYVTYIATTPAKVWNALVDPKITATYWQHVNVSDWKPGSQWEHRRGGTEGALMLVGKVIESAPPRRLAITWADPKDRAREEGHSRVTFEIEKVGTLVKLAVTHNRLEPGSKMVEGIRQGWPKVLSSLKTLLETGKALPELW